MTHKYDVDRFNSLSLLRVAEALGLTVNKSGKTCCFIHEENTPSLHISERRKFWYCFGCGAHGTAIDLVMAHEKLDFLKACRWMEDAFNISQGGSSLWNRRAVVPKPRSVPKSLASVATHKTPDPEVYEWLFEHSSLSEQGNKYLVDERKLTSQTISTFHLRDINNTAQIFDSAKQKWGISRLYNCGLAKSDDLVNYRFAWWGHILLIPFYNESGNIVSIQGRILNDPKYKYINLNDVPTDIFNAQILSRLPEHSRICICEGAMDAIVASQNGINAVGISGATAFKRDWVNRFRNHEIFVVPDNDDAGRNFATRIQSMFEEIGRAVRIITLPATTKDVSDYFNSLL